VQRRRRSSPAAGVAHEESEKHVMLRVRMCGVQEHVRGLGESAWILDPLHGEQQVVSDFSVFRRSAVSKTTEVESAAQDVVARRAKRSRFRRRRSLRLDSSTPAGDMSRHYSSRDNEARRSDDQISTPTTRTLPSCEQALKLSKYSDSVLLRKRLLTIAESFALCGQP
jgi:hypothetical protein